MQEPIAAIATGHSPCAIGIVRISGEGCFDICQRVFHPVSCTFFTDMEPRRMVLGDVLDSEGRIIDRGMAVRFPAPHSYTGEDCAEFHCHGSPVVLRELLHALFDLGVRQAEAGEFTKRAFLNGQLDLTEAEAVIDLIDAETAAAARNAAAQLDGGLRRVLEPIQDALLEVASRFYAVVDYPDEDITDVHPEEIAHALDTSGAALETLLSSCRRGRILKSGVRTAIIGRTNAGKSSLLNALAGFDRAIVTAIPGTTRDTVEESVLCGGILLRLTDTAGLRESGDTVERLGIERSRRAAEGADLILVVADSSATWSEEDREAVSLALASGKPWILVWNKTDLTGELPDPVEARSNFPPVLLTEPEKQGGQRSPHRIVYLSTKTGAGLPDLEAAVVSLFPAGEADRPGTFLTDVRQEEAAQRARRAIRRAADALSLGLTPDAILTDVEDALDAIGDLTGRTAKTEIVERIFSRFCVGK